MQAQARTDLDKALENGAEGVIFKSAADTELIKAIRKVANGEKYVSSDVAKLLASDPPIPPPRASPAAPASGGATRYSHPRHTS